MKNSNNLLKIVWIIGIYAILGAILYLVIVYKVEWEHKDLNTYLYFYDCNFNLCTSTSKQDDYYSKIMCEDDLCPYITDIIGNNLILKRDDKSWIYNYINDKVVNNTYLNYNYIRDNLFVFTDSYGKQGVLDLVDGVMVQSEYDYIDNYKNGFVSYRKNGLYGINAIDGLYNVDAIYEKVVLINNKMYAGMKDNVYYLYSYDSNSPISDKYNFVYAYNDVIFVINNKKIDILNAKLDSTILMKIDTFYEYSTEKERDSLNFYFDGENIHFNVFISETEYTTYKYNINSKKIV